MFCRDVCTYTCNYGCNLDICMGVCNLKLSKTLRGAGTDASAEIRSARKKSRDKVRQFPDDETVYSVQEEDQGTPPHQAAETSQTGDTSTPLQGMWGITTDLVITIVPIISCLYNISAG